MLLIFSGRSAAWLAHQTGGLGVAGSNPAIPTILVTIDGPAPSRAVVVFGLVSPIVGHDDEDASRCGVAGAILRRDDDGVGAIALTVT